MFGNAVFEASNVHKRTGLENGLPTILDEFFSFPHEGWKTNIVFQKFSTCLAYFNQHAAIAFFKKYSDPNLFELGLLFDGWSKFLAFVFFT